MTGKLAWTVLKLLVVVAVVRDGAMSGASAQPRDPVTICHAIKDGAARLACYDRLPIQLLNDDATTFQQITLTDLKLDLRNLVGRKIEVAGLIRADAETLQLRSVNLDNDPVFVSLKAVSREQRGAILKQCVDGCMVTVRATVIPSKYNTKPTLEADSVIVR